MRWKFFSNLRSPLCLSNTLHHDFDFSKGVPVMEANGSQALHQDSPLLAQEKTIMITKRKRGRPPKSVVKTPMGLSQGCSHCSNDDDSDEPDASSPAIHNNRETTEYQQKWPFIKESPIWATIESLELYQNRLQKPHFLLLKKQIEDCREGAAIGHMVTFVNVVKRTKKLQADDPNDVIEDSLETLVELETHGFDVGGVRARLNEFLSRKAEVGDLKDKLKQGEKEIDKLKLEKLKTDEEVDELERKIQELQEKLVESVKKKKVKGEEIVEFESKTHLVANKIMDWKVDFGKFAATPF